MAAEPDRGVQRGDVDGTLAYRHRPDLQVSRSIDERTRESQIFVKSPATGEVVLFGEEEHALFESLDGETSFAAIDGAFRARFGVGIARRDFDAFLQYLLAAGMIEPIDAGGAETEPAADITDLEPEPEQVSADAPREDADAGAQQGGRMPWGVRLFDPSPMFSMLAWMFRPVRFVVWLLVPATLFAGLILFHRQAELMADLQQVFRSRSFVAHFILALLFHNVYLRLVHGAIIQGFGGQVKHLGIMMAFGLLPRFYIDGSSTPKLSQRGQLWVFGGQWLARLSVFVGGAWVWATHRGDGTALSHYALIVGQLGFWMSAITALPIIPGVGYRWLSTYINQPNLRDRALQLLGMRLRGRPAPAAMSAGEKWGLLFFATGSVLFTAVLVAGLFLYLGTSLERQFRGTGVILFLGIFTIIVLWFSALKAGAGRMKSAPGRDAAPHGAPAPAMQAGSHGAIVPFHPHLPALREGREIQEFVAAPIRTPVRRRSRAWAVWAVLLAILGGLSFVPYPYEAGGEFKILPNTRYEVRARVDGELVRINVGEGDQVEANQVLAVASQWRQERDLAVARSDLDKAKANLATLLGTPKPEEVALAKRQVESVAARIPFAKAEAARMEKLIKTKTISVKRFEAAQSEYEKAITDLAVAKANLDLISAGPLPSEIEAARAEVNRLTQEVSFREDELERTRLRATTRGQVVTPNLRYLKGKHLKEGDLFAEIEDHSISRAEIEVPETDVSEVRIGSKVRLKTWASTDDIRVGTVVAIAPLAETRDYSRIVRVATNIPNDDFALKPGMSGYAKIEGKEMPAWRAFTRMFMRFFLVEVWSWFP